MKLFLASASPRRAELLRNAGIPFEVFPSAIDEVRLPGEAAVAMVLRLAQSKACAAAQSLRSFSQPAIVIAADTTVELAGKVFGKPGSPDEARRMLAQLSGKTHHVLTGVAAIRLPDVAMLAGVEDTAVRFATIDSRGIDEYAATDEPSDKAGAYAIQGLAGRFVERIEGCYFNVVGLPLARLYRMLLELGWRPDTP